MENSNAQEITKTPRKRSRQQLIIDKAIAAVRLRKRERKFEKRRIKREKLRKYR